MYTLFTLSQAYSFLDTIVAWTTFRTQGNTDQQDFKLLTKLVSTERGETKVTIIDQTHTYFHVLFKNI